MSRDPDAMWGWRQAIDQAAARAAAEEAKEAARVAAEKAAKAKADGTATEEDAAAEAALPPPPGDPDAYKVRCRLYHTLPPRYRRSPFKCGLVRKGRCHVSLAPGHCRVGTKCRLSESPSRRNLCRALLHYLQTRSKALPAC